MPKTEEIVAYKGGVELDLAQWDNSWGMTVRVKLEQRPHEMNAANPFKRFTKMRKGKVGTRFRAVFADGEDILYDDEVMLKGWSDGTTGWKLTLWISEDEHGFHPFMNFNKGKAFALAMVELDVDDEPVNQKKRDRYQRAQKAKRQGYRLSSYAAMLCQTPEFMDYVNETIGADDDDRLEDADQIASWMRAVLGIESRRELDHSDEVARQFHEEIRKPYREWRGEG